MISKIILTVSDKIKPFLMAIFPKNFLRICKRKVIDYNFGKLKKISAPVYHNGYYKHGINIIGNIKGRSGLGQSCRLLAGLVDKAGVDSCIYHYNQFSTELAEDNTWNDRIVDDVEYDINLIHINPHEWPVAYMQLDSRLWKHRYNIAYWLWELEEFPDKWIPCFNCINEIWTPSEFISKAIRKKTNLPVRTIPYYLELSTDLKYNRSFFNLPENKFLFLVMYDHNSILERKNPKAAFEAYRNAFEKNFLEVGIVVKVGNCTDEDMEVINSILDGYENVYIITENLSREQVNGLIQAVDVFVSLHRAEGFGLVLAEAMYLGTPTIATNWSANVEFMNSEVACMVDYKLVKLERDYPPFETGNRWAEPDFLNAAKWMRKLYNDKVFYAKISENAQAYIKKILGIEMIQEKLLKECNRIWYNNENKDK